MIDLYGPTPQQQQTEQQRLAAKVAADLQETRNLRMIGAAITGPVMIYTGLEKKLPKPLKALMIAVGVGIMASNVQKLRGDG